MSKLLILSSLIALFSSCALAQDPTRMGFIFNTDAERYARDKAAQDQHEAQRYFDSWRIINGEAKCIWFNPKTASYYEHQSIAQSRKYLVKNCFEFGGRVIAVHKNGIVVVGWSTYPKVVAFQTEFFIANFPYRVAENDNLEPHVAFLDSAVPLETFETATGSKTIHRLDYGNVTREPISPLPKILTVADLAAAKAAADKRAGENAAKALAWNRAQAEKGDPYGQFRMGERYLAGDGVAKDPQQARAWFAKAAARGHSESKRILEKLNKILAAGKN